MKNTNPEISRRSTLKFLAGVPLLPLAAAGLEGRSYATTARSAARFWSPSNRSPIQSLTFAAMPAPALSDAAAMATTTVRSSMVATYVDGSVQSFPLAYEPFFITGDLVPDGRGGTTLAGGYYDIRNQPILDATDPNNRHFFSDCPDGMSLIAGRQKQRGVCGNTVHAVVQFEYATRDHAGQSRYGMLPSPIAVLTLDQDPATGRLKLVKYSNVDTSSVHGLWITCGASMSPWGTHLSSEEYEPDATTIENNAQFKAFSLNLYGDEKQANPYHYGHLPEVSVNPDGSGSIKKHFCVGRISHELVQVMPDERTVIMGDDATNGGLFLFIADRPRDLSSGTLYVAKWLQKTAEKGGSADLQWIQLGRAKSEDIRALADNVVAADILDCKTADPQDASYTKIRCSGKDNWVKWKPGMELAAAFLETHRYAAYRGASMGFTKSEGVTVNAQDKVAYAAISSITSSMIDGTTDIKVKGPKSGAVYALNLRGGQKDDTGSAMNSDWVPVDMAAIPELVGEDLSIPDSLGNLAHAEHVANPDNIKYSESLRTLFVGEDSGMHVNNFLWAFHIDNRTLTRLLSCPAGAESTGLQAADDVNGFTYILSNFQHPGDWDVVRDANGVITGGLHAKVFEQLDPLVRANYKDRFGAAVGYLAGIPAVAPYLPRRRPSVL